ncbi:MAG TPA: putative lipid II flippase FtsW [Nakamurella sp.]|nr:putative lipid II flippase FtsW [Nakamurella sp.]
MTTVTDAAPATERGHGETAVRPGRATRTPRPAGRGPVTSVLRMAKDWLDRPMASLHLILAIFGLMLGFGLLMVLSSSSATAFRRSDSAFAVFVNQSTFAVLGLVAFFFTMRMPLRLMRTASTTAVIVALAMLVAVLVPGIGSNYNGASSWINIGSGLQFQPSEVAKLALLLWSAHVLAARRSTLRRLRSLLIPVLPVFLLMVGLVMLQPDLGTTVTLAIVFLSVLYFAGAPLWLFGGVASMGLAAVVYLATSAGYRAARVTAFLHPDTADPQFTYQLFQGLYAMGSGGLFGVGIGQSKMKWGRLPNADSDFIFAVIGEELGLLGTLTVVVLFALLAYTGLRIARRNVDPFVKIVAAAGTVWLVGQAMINIGYVVGLLPVTGLPLPMFSAGGTSLVITMVVFGLLANFARREPQAATALRGLGPRGLSAFLGIGTRTAAPASGRVTRRRAKRQARRAAAAARRLDELQFYGGRYGDERVGPRGGRPARGGPRPAGAGRGTGGGTARGGGRGSAGRTGPRQGHRIRRALGFPVPERPRYRMRRALGFPVPGEQPVRARSGRRPSGPGRTVRP